MHWLTLDLTIQLGMVGRIHAKLGTRHNEQPLPKIAGEHSVPIRYYVEWHTM
jgi:hypothetical protein